LTRQDLSLTRQKCRCRHKAPAQWAHTVSWEADRSGEALPPRSEVCVCVSASKTATKSSPGHISGPDAPGRSR